MSSLASLFLYCGFKTTLIVVAYVGLQFRSSLVIKQPGTLVEAVLPKRPCFGRVCLSCSGRRLGRQGLLTSRSQRSLRQWPFGPHVIRDGLFWQSVHWPASRSRLSRCSRGSLAMASGGDQHNYRPRPQWTSRLCHWLRFNQGIFVCVRWSRN